MASPGVGFPVLLWGPAGGLAYFALWSLCTLPCDIPQTHEPALRLVWWYTYTSLCRSCASSGPCARQSDQTQALRVPWRCEPGETGRAAVVRAHTRGLCIAESGVSTPLVETRVDMLCHDYCVVRESQHNDSKRCGPMLSARRPTVASRQSRSLAVVLKPKWGRRMRLRSCALSQSSALAMSFRTVVRETRNRGRHSLIISTSLA